MPLGPWEIRVVDLGSELRDLSPTSANALCIFFELDGVVIGSANLCPVDLPMDAVEVAALAAEKVGAVAWQLFAYGPYSEARASLPGERRQTAREDAFFPRPEHTLQALRRTIASRRNRAIASSVSIVICTRRRPGLLARCLAACAPELEKGREIIVVDNGPDESTRCVVAGVAGVRYVEEPKPGVSRARNTGVRASTGDIVVFVDDDIIPAPGWIDNLLIGYGDPDVALVTGLVLPAELDYDAQIIFEFGFGFGGMGFVPLRFDAQYFNAHKSRAVPVWNIGGSGNSAVRRDAFDKIGGFSENLGPGTAAPCSEDSEFFYRILAAGFEIRYEPFAIVRHSHRQSADELRKQIADYMTGHVAALFVQYSTHSHWGNLRRAFLTMPASYCRSLVGCMLRGWRGDYDVLFWPRFLGYLRGLSHLRLMFSGGEKRPASGTKTWR